MKRGLVFTLCAVALAAYSTNAQAQAPTVNLSLNLRYTNPGNPAAGGTWQLVAETNSTIGIAGISAYISNISTTGIVYGNGTSITAATLGAITDGGLPYFGTFGGAVNIVYGQDTASGPIVANVGRGDAVAAPGELVNDPLFNPTWNGASLIASGSFPGGGNAGNNFNRPAFVTAGANSTDANTLSGPTAPANASIDATTTTTVRGDSVRHFNLESAGGVEGLEWGDANRDFTVNNSDFNAVLNNFFAAGTWDTGDVGGSGTTPATPGNVDNSDFNSVLNNFFSNQTPPSVGAVPEPATAALAAMGLAGALLVRRRK